MTSTSADIDPAWLRPTWFLDSDHPDVVAFAEKACAGAESEREKAVALFLAVRDGIRYDPYAAAGDPEAFRASAVAKSEANWCVPKSVLLVAAARASGIPARLGFADVRNHLTSEKLSAHMGTDVFAWHGYAELLLDGRWLKVSSAFNIEMCERFGVKVLEFDGTADALMHPYDQAGNRHMEYVRERGSHDDLPLDEIFATFAEVYPSSVMGEGEGAGVAGDDAFA